ncbi:MAG: addiction module protein [Acidobacteria bacterium]|nr:addiction module protein [Acidobacteriota bacterium]
MSELSHQVLKQALSLPPEERAEVAELLLSSLDPATQRRIDSLWAEEAEDRLDAFNKGEIRAVPARDVFDEVTKQKR